MQGHQKHSHRLNRLSGVGSIMDETDREVSSLTDRAFRSLCIAEGLHDEPKSIIAAPRKAAFHVSKSRNTKNKKKSVNEINALKKLSVENDINKEVEFISLQPPLLNTVQEETNVNNDIVTGQNKNHPCLTPKKNKPASKVSSLIKAFSTNEELVTESTVTSEKLNENHSKNDKMQMENHVENEDAAVVLKLQKELLEQSTKRQGKESNRLGENNELNAFKAKEIDSKCAVVSGHDQRAPPSVNSNKKTAKNKSEKVSRDKKLPSKMSFLHSENSAFKSWKGHKNSEEEDDIDNMLNISELSNLYDKALGIEEVHKAVHESFTKKETVKINKEKQHPAYVQPALSVPQLAPKSEESIPQTKSEVATVCPPWRRSRSTVSGGVKPEWVVSGEQNKIKEVNISLPNKQAVPDFEQNVCSKKTFQHCDGTGFNTTKRVSHLKENACSTKELSHNEGSTSIAKQQTAPQLKENGPSANSLPCSRSPTNNVTKWQRGLPYKENNTASQEISHCESPSLTIDKQLTTSHPKPITSVKQMTQGTSPSFNITKLLTPIIPTKQETESTEIGSIVLTPPITDKIPNQDHDAKGVSEYKSRESYKSKAPSLLFNLKDVRKLVKSTYSPSCVPKISEEKSKNKETGKLDSSLKHVNALYEPQKLIENIKDHSANKEVDQIISTNQNELPSLQTSDVKAVPNKYDADAGKTDNYLTLSSPQTIKDSGSLKESDTIVPENNKQQDDVKDMLVPESNNQQDKVKDILLHENNKQKGNVNEYERYAVSSQQFMSKERMKCPNLNVHVKEEVEGKPTTPCFVRKPYAASQFSEPALYTSKNNNEQQIVPSSRKSSLSPILPVWEKESYQRQICLNPNKANKDSKSNAFSRPSYLAMESINHFEKGHPETNDTSEDSGGKYNKLVGKDITNKEGHMGKMELQYYDLSNGNSKIDKKGEKISSEVNGESERMLKEGMKELLKQMEISNLVEPLLEENSYKSDASTPTTPSTPCKLTMFSVKDNTFKSPPLIRTVKLPMLKPFSENVPSDNTKETAIHSQNANPAVYTKESYPGLLPGLQLEKLQSSSPSEVTGHETGSAFSNVISDNKVGIVTVAVPSEDIGSLEFAGITNGAPQCGISKHVSNDLKDSAVTKIHENRESIKSVSERCDSGVASGGIEDYTTPGMSDDIITSSLSERAVDSALFSPFLEATKYSIHRSMMSEDMTHFPESVTPQRIKTDSTLEDKQEHAFCMNCAEMPQQTANVDNYRSASQILNAVPTSERTTGKPPTVPPKSEKAVRRAKKLANRKKKTKVIQNKDSGDIHRTEVSGVCSVPTSPTPEDSTSQHLAFPEINSSVLDSSLVSALPNILALSGTQSVTPMSSFPVTQRKLLQDPESGQYFVVDIPIQMKEKTFYDPETGRYIQVSVPSAESDLSQASSLEVLNTPYLLYPSFLSLPLTTVTTIRSPSQLSAPAALMEEHIKLEDPLGYIIDPNDTYQSEGAENHPYIEPVYNPYNYKYDEFVHNPEKHMAECTNSDIISLNELEDFAFDNL